MAESSIYNGLSETMLRPAMERARSLRDIDQQYSRIENRLYRQYLDFEIDEDTYNKRMETIRNAYDRYQTNILNTEVPGWQRGMAYPKEFSLYNRPIARGVYTRRK